MVLNIPGVPQLFKHSQENSQGMGKEKSGEIIVSKEGRGDFDTIQEAINAAVFNTTIRIKNGTYDEDLILKSGVTLRGDGWGTEIILRGYNGIQISNLNTVEIKDLKLIITATDAGDEIHIDINAASKITFENVFFEVTNTNSTEGIIWTSGGNNATDIRILNCRGENTGTGNCTRFFYAELNFTIIKNNTFKVWNINADDAHIDNSLIKGNILKNVYLMAGSDNNVVTGNQLDNAATNLGAGNQIANNALY